MEKVSFNSIIRKQPPKDVFYRGNLKISASASQHRHRHRHWNLHYHRHCKKFGFCLQKLFFEKRMFMFFLVLICGITTTLPQIRFPCHTSKCVHWCTRKRLFELSQAPVCGCFEKNNCFKTFWICCILSSKTSTLEFFMSTLGDLPGIFPKSSLEQLCWRELVGPASVKWNFTEHVISGTFQNFKNMQD